MKRQRTLLFLCLGAVLLLAACVQEPGTAETPTPPPYSQATPTLQPDSTPSSTPDGPGETNGDETPGVDENGETGPGDGVFVHPAADLVFEGFTHFPVDFAKVFTGLDHIDHRYGIGILIPFYTHQGRIAVRKWYIYDFSPPPYTEVYAPADSMCSLDPFAPAEGITEIEGYAVHVNTRLRCWVSETIGLDFGHITLLDEVIQRIESVPNDPNFGRDAFFAAGEHIGFIYFPAEDHTHSLDFAMFDYGHNSGKLSNPEHFLNTGVNPLDYFVDELREELISLYEPVYEAQLARGTEPFTDITDSRGNINVAGTLEGLWFRNDLPSFDSLPPENMQWNMLSFVGIGKLHAETYWRVLEHPWNVENNFAGLFNEWPFGVRPDNPLYEGEMLETSRFYLIEGDLTSGVAMILNNFWTWDPAVEDHDTNHPSRGERRYLRFQVQYADDIWQEVLRIQGFLTEEEAQAGFTDTALEFRRDPEVVPVG